MIHTHTWIIKESKKKFFTLEGGNEMKKSLDLNDLCERV